jgi:hypothetical protein
LEGENILIGDVAGYRLGCTRLTYSCTGSSGDTFLKLTSAAYPGTFSNPYGRAPRLRRRVPTAFVVSADRLPLGIAL